MVVFSQGAAKAFEDKMVLHLKRCFPEKFGSIGEPKARELIQLGVERSESYGIRAARDVSKFIDLMIVLGAGFDTDPKLDWASSILTDPDFSDASQRIEELQRAAIRYTQGATEDGER